MPPEDPIREEALDWLLKTEAAPDDARLRAELAAWRAQSPAHDQAFRSVARAWRLAGDLPPGYADQVRGPRPAGTVPGAGRAARAHRRADPRAGRAPVRRRMAFAAAGLAACLAALLAPGLPLRLKADHVSGAEIREVVLEDGSRLYLDAGSAVAVDYGPARRMVRLIAGRAFFDVTPTPTRPFAVATPGLTVTVTGTGFAVELGATGTSVVVQSGSVDVATHRPDAPVVRLAPGDRLTLAHATGAVRRSRVPPADVAAWREGRLVVEGVPLAELVARLDRYHRGIIWVADAGLAGRRITGIFNLHDPIAALRAAAATQGAEVTALTPYLLVVTRP